MSNAQAGALGEQIAATYLELRGCRILARGTRIAGVQIDVVARRHSMLLVVEVKLRGTPRAVAADALGTAQRRRLRRAAEVLLARAPDADSVRIDAVGIDLHAGGLVLQHWSGIAD